jgi:aminopeptidase YwaD
MELINAKMRRRKGAKKKTSLIATIFLFVAGAQTSESQVPSIIGEDAWKAIIQESSGELALRHFAALIDYSGWAPSLGAEQTAQYLVERSREIGLADIRVEKFASDGKRFVWAFQTEPWWEGRRGELWLTTPERKRLASFDVFRGHLARYSTSTVATAELVDVGGGTDALDYEGKDISGKIVLATGRVGQVHQEAVWRRGAAGVVIYRTREHLEYPDLVDTLSIEPWEGPDGETPAFAFSLSHRVGSALAERIRSGESLYVHVDVEAETRAGAYPQVHATLPGTEPDLPEVWIVAHTNHRNSGGGNNLTGVGATLDTARTLAKLIEDGTLPRPRRSIRFVWGAEHMATQYYFHEHPDAVSSVLALLDLDMVGDHQVLSQSILRLYRTPDSLPSFVSDIVQETFEAVAAGNSYSLVSGRRLLDLSSKFLLPIVETTGSHDPFYFQIEPFWGPSDHEDVAEASLGIAAVLLNDWPDPYIGTQEDSIERADATQMKRSIVIAAASAYVAASAGADDVPMLMQNSLSKARSRLAEEEHRATRLVDRSTQDSASDSLWGAENIARQAYRREAETLRSLAVFAETGASKALVDSAVAELAAGERRAIERLRRHAAIVAESREWGPVTPEPPPRGEAARLVPSRTMVIRGPVNFFRPQYGLEWMKAKLGDPRFVEKVRLARFGHYYLYETLNFADGKRNLGQIQELVAAEYGLAPLDEIAEYFRLLESVGIVSLSMEREAASGDSLAVKGN